MARYALTAALLGLATAVPVTINNMVPRLDNQGNILDGHDGRLQKFPHLNDGKYWLHTLSYGLCNEPQGQGCNQTPDKCGFRLDHNITIWTSTNLSSGSWQYEGVAMTWTDRPEGTVFRPDLVYNPNTQKFVLYYNWVAANGTYMGFSAWTADAPTGPFTKQRDVVMLSHANYTYHAGDFHLFVDDDGTGYIIYGAEFWMYIEQLTPDYLDSAGKWVEEIGGIYFVEAPALIKRNGVYLAMFDHCCCFCYQGSGIRVYSAPTPLGPWTAQGGDIACVPPSEGDSSSPAALAPAPATYRSGLGYLTPITPLPTPGQGCLYNNSNTVSTTRSQQSQVAIVNTPTGPLYLWIGDRWQQAPDGIKGHEPQFWVPLQFDANGIVQPVSWTDNFSMDVI